MQRRNYYYYHKTDLLFHSYLMNINAVVERPNSLEVILHAALELLRDLMKRKKVLQVSPFCLIQRSSRIHSLDYSGYVAENHCVH